MVILRTILPSLAALLLCGCASVEGARPEPVSWGPDLKQGARTVAAATARGAAAVGDSLGTAYDGVTNGFEDPGAGGFGPYPKDYVDTIRKHMLRFENVPATASFRFGQPQRAYLNKGLLRGGKVEWRGWIVSVAIGSKTAFGQPHTDEYVVRMNDGEVIDVLAAEYASALRVAEPQPPAAPAAAAR